jgi:hypothetical protein
LSSWERGKFTLIETRKQLDDLLDRRLNKTFESLKEEQELKYEQGLVKSYIIESNLSQISDILLPKVYDVSIKKTNDPNLSVLNFDHKNQSSGTLYLDTSNKRFVVAHTVNRTSVVDNLIRRIVEPMQSNLDQPWIPIEMLKEIPETEELRGFSVKYDDRFYSKDLESSVDISMRLWGNSANKILSTLNNEKTVNHSIAVSAVGVKYSSSIENFAIDDISYHGKLTARGTSINDHYYLIERVISEYSELLEDIENQSISYETSEDGCRLEGSPVTIDLKREIDDLPRFINVLLA